MKSVAKRFQNSKKYVSVHNKHIIKINYSLPSTKTAAQTFPPQYLAHSWYAMRLMDGGGGGGGGRGVVVTIMQRTMMLTKETKLKFHKVT